MITYMTGADLRLRYEWTDPANVGIPITAATFAINDEIVYELGDVDRLELGSEPYVLELHLPVELLDANDDPVPPGNHSYVLVAQSTTDTVIMSAGLLRVRTP